MTGWKLSMGPLVQIADPYARQARLAPALITIFPAVLVCVVWLPALQSLLGGLASIAVSFGILLWVSQIARDAGKQKEPALFQTWGGKPSVAFLRAADARLDATTKARYRAFLIQKVPGLKFPTHAEAAASVSAEDEACTSATAWLLTQTRDTRKFALLFQENVSYGFRRNLWGLKPIGITISFLAGVTALGLIYVSSANHEILRPERLIVTGLVWLFFLWWLRVSNAWVKIPADAYAKELLAACDVL